ncbi:serine O-acetyltransferase [Mycobacterium sp. SMC-4]|uniref:serine O-acetyltransferase n=1 Tax=Mycobacterium sp. SMC-4 TaxID=2857059 RepID=UPI003D042775
MTVQVDLPVGRLSASNAILLKWRLMTWLWGRGPYASFVARVIRGHIRRTYGCYLSPASKVGRAVYLPHPVGVVVGDNATICDGVTIYQHVTIGQAQEAGLCPRIGRGAKIFAGAVLIGDIVIGDGAVIGANAVVRSSVPPNEVAVGVPARVVGRSRQ